MSDMGDKKWTTKHYDINMIVDYIKKLDDFSDPKSASYKVVQKLIDEMHMMEAKAMRAYILECPRLGHDNPAIITALEAVEHAEKILQHKSSQSFIDTTPTLSLGYSANSPKSFISEYDRSENTSTQYMEENDFYTDETPLNATNSKFLKIVIMLRSIFIDTPLALLFFIFIVVASARHMYWVYYSPLIDAYSWYGRNERIQSEYTYYHRPCDESDVSSLNTDDFIIDPDSTTPQEAVDITNKHGVAIFPKILSPSTALEMRDFVMRRNNNLTNDDAIPLISQEHRWSFPIGGNDDPSVPPVLREIATNAMLQSSLNLLLGDDPAVVEFTAITSAYGAGDQHWHADTDFDASDVHFSRSFVPIYSLFIPLQDTTSLMGATSTCPGTHLCGDSTYLSTVCEKLNLQINDSRGRLAVEDNDHVWKMGDGFLMHLNTYHRGPGHTDPDGAERVMLIMSISSRPEGSQFDRKILSLGTSYSNRWDMWGLTMKDLLDIEKAMTFPWKILRALNIYKPKDSNWGWSYLTSICARLLNDQMGFRWGDLIWFTQKVSRKNILLQYMIGQLPMKRKTDDGWREYFDETFERCFLGFLGAYVISAFLYIFIGCAFGCGTRSTFRLFKMNTVIGIPFLFMLHRVSITPWGQDIILGKIHDPPFAKLSNGTSITHELMSEGITTNPLAKDIFIASRYSSDHLPGYYSVLHSQPGNTHLNLLISNVSGNFHNSPLLSVAADQIIDEVKKEGRRFLWQNGNGDWSILSMTQVTKLVQTMLLTRSNPYLKYLKKEIELILTVCMHGRNRNTAMFMKHTREMILSLEQMLFPTDFLPCSSKRKETINSFQQPLFLPLKKPKREHRMFEDNVDKKPSFSIGEYTEGQFGRSWFSGRVINSQGDVITVQYDDGIIEQQSVDLLRKFVGYQKGETVIVNDGSIGKIRTVKAIGKVILDDSVRQFEVPTREIQRLD